MVPNMHKSNEQQSEARQDDMKLYSGVSVGWNTLRDCLSRSMKRTRDGATRAEDMCSMMVIPEVLHSKRNISAQQHIKFVYKISINLSRLPRSQNQVDVLWKSKTQYIHEFDNDPVFKINFKCINPFSQSCITNFKRLCSVIDEREKVAFCFKVFGNLANELRSRLAQTVERSPRWCFVHYAVENSMAFAGWAGTAKSSRTELADKPPVKDLVFLQLYGTMGKYIGSYDSKRFLERLVALFQKYEGAKEVYCYFRNDSGTCTYSLPEVMIDDIHIRPKFVQCNGRTLFVQDTKETKKDCSPAFHDACRLANLWNKCHFQLDDDGYAILKA